MQRVTYRVPRPAAGEPQTTLLRLDQALALSEEARRYGLSRTLIRKLLVAGAVYVNGRRVRVASRSMHGGEVIDVYFDKEKSPDRMPAIDRFAPLRVLYEDDAIICFDKPAGLPTQPTLDEARANLYEMAKAQLAKAAGKPVYLGLHHRLDRDTSGVVLFTRDKRVNAFIGDLFKEHNLSKTYVAVVHGVLKNPKGRVESFLGEVSRRGKQAKFGTVHSGGKKAITDFLVLGTDGQKSLVEVKITTGRTHQIRVHLSEAGHPVVGDTLYGSPTTNYATLGRFLLHAHALGLEHPVTRNTVRIESPVPPLFRL